jgi:hypothetical protein
MSNIIRDIDEYFKAIERDDIVNWSKWIYINCHTKQISFPTEDEWNYLMDTRPVGEEGWDAIPRLLAKRSSGMPNGTQL